MKKNTLLQVINNAKSGIALDPNECRDTILALHSMLTQSRMTIETIASCIGNETNTHIAARGLLWSLDYVRDERDRWMNSEPQAWLIINNHSANLRNDTTPQICGAKDNNVNNQQNGNNNEF